MDNIEKLKKIIGNKRFEHWHVLERIKAGSIYNYFSNEELEELARATINKIKEIK